jgi:hypothetical protein
MTLQDFNPDVSQKTLKVIPAFNTPGAKIKYLTMR